MTIRQGEQPRDPSTAIAEGAIAEYLAAHPEFFEHHTDLVAELRVPHASGQAVSLIERQVEILREQLRTERQRLARLIAGAQNFEVLSARLHHLTLQLITAPDLARVEAVLSDTLCRQFEAEAVLLRLFPLAPDAPDSDPNVAAFVRFLDREHSLCGPLDAEHNAILFGERSRVIGSAVLIPIRTEDHCGVLAIGSRDLDRFEADMGTDLLDRLGEIVSHKLRSLYPSHEGFAASEGYLPYPRARRDEE